jgi:hypothetical protein
MARDDFVNTILAVVTTDMNKVKGGTPIFYAKDEQELEKLALYLSKILFGMAHDLENGIYVIVRH